MMQSVIEEKSNRVVEVLLSSINSHDFMKGKIFGNAITGILQMVVWLSPLMLLISTTWFILPKEFVLSIDWSNIVFYLINYSIGLTTFLGLFTCVGSMFDNSQDAQQGMWPIILLVMIPFFMSFTLQNNPDSSFAIITSITPVTSLIIMPARITMVDVPFFQLLLSQVMNLLFLVFVFYLAGKIYRVGILATGSKPTLAEIINWIKN
jgi:ABC-2 type transport system permease protein